MASAAAGRGAQTVNSTYFKPMLRKAYHRKSGSPDMISDTMKLNGEEVKHKSTTSTAGNGDANWWVRDDRTRIYYPKGHEKVIEDVPQGAGKDFGAINWFD
ncbi:hypothetical protein BUALT_Bualt07G0107300 [Buddleja alternifolia]|uniref:Late embryogenesis abundant protein n=1 Tax=Buddleja alternifolia TaxID=168488 RepID=A0AAV6X937_9LAMI|nr:hypothetical protein BUALT_Bualt07G0107300 [Buddleja alternifolia]